MHCSAWEQRSCALRCCELASAGALKLFNCNTTHSRRHSGATGGFWESEGCYGEVARPRGQVCVDNVNGWSGPLLWCCWQPVCPKLAVKHTRRPGKSRSPPWQHALQACRTAPACCAHAAAGWFAPQHCPQTEDTRPHAVQQMCIGTRVTVAPQSPHAPFSQPGPHGTGGGGGPAASRPPHWMEAEGRDALGVWGGGEHMRRMGNSPTKKTQMHGLPRTACNSGVVCETHTQGTRGLMPSANRMPRWRPPGAHALLRPPLPTLLARSKT